MLEKNLSNDKSLEVNVAISRKKCVALFLTRKMTGNRVNPKPENWQCTKFGGGDGSDGPACRLLASSPLMSFSVRITSASWLGLLYGLY